jgi:dynein assembly factor 3
MATSGLSTTKSLGVHGHWGFSATFDMVEAMLAIDRSFAELSTMNILLVHPGDIRHILLTASRLRRHFGPSESKPRIRFYLLENNLELIARELILLELLFDVEVPIRQRSNIFLEIFGNLYVQKRTNAYIEVLSKRLLTMMGNRCCTLNTIINFEHLSFKQNDELEKVLKYYNRSNIFQVEKYFDHRKRGLYEDRYDSRQAIFDWDYHSTLKRKASIVHIKQYKHWRETGIAFEFGDQKYSEPNKSFMSFTEGFIKAGVDKGSKKEVQGYWGDIVVSPFIGLGISSDTPNRHAEGLYEMYNKVGNDIQTNILCDCKLFISL